MLSDKLFELAEEVRRQGVAAGEDCDCRAYETDFYAIEADIRALAEEAQADELQRLADATEQDHIDGR